MQLNASDASGICGLTNLVGVPVNENTDGTSISWQRLDDLPRRLLDAADDSGPVNAKYYDAIKDAKRQLIMNALEKSNGNYTEAAKALGIHPNNLHRIIRTLDLKTAVAK